MKPKPFWPLNHFTVPVDIEVLSLSKNTSMAARKRDRLVEIKDECRQTGALFAARPSRSAETRWVIHRRYRAKTQAQSVSHRLSFLGCWRRSASTSGDLSQLSAS